MEKYVIVLDQGTASSGCTLFDHKGDICSMAQREFTQVYPQPEQVEHDPMGIWPSQLGVMMEVIGGVGTHVSEVTAIGITNQREATVIWNKKTGVPIYNAIMRQCQRTSDMIERLKVGGMEQLVEGRTDLTLDAYFSGDKAAQILDHMEGARERVERGELPFGTVDTWLIWNLTKGAVYITGYINAFRTMLYDIRKLYQDKEVLDYFDIPVCMLPEMKSSGCLFGCTSEEVIGRRVPIAGVAEDQQAVLFGRCCFEAGEVKNTYGAEYFLLMNAGEKAVVSESGLLTTVAANCGGQVEYVLEGSVFVTGASIQWLRDGLRMIKTTARSEEYCNSADGTAGIYIVPAFAGLGTPYWHQYTRGTIMGLTRGASKEHLTRATVGSLAYQVYDLLEAMQKGSGIKLHALKVDGGASANNFLIQFRSDILDTTVIRPQYIEAAALGVAYLAELAVGYWEDKEGVRKDWRTDQRFHSKIIVERRAELAKGWKRAVRCALFWAESEGGNEV